MEEILEIRPIEELFAEKSKVSLVGVLLIATVAIVAITIINQKINLDIYENIDIE